uniref:RRM domain-containing protein n=1 Tax=Lactuca sativa TaxID=4236 RepID=A0A9R1WPJ4_LACSA|nr:hypothetical protein LSAT_V11C100032480 [Lactuca sativa]
MLASIFSQTQAISMAANQRDLLEDNLRAASLPGMDNTTKLCLQFRNRNEVMFTRISDAFQAFEHYNNIQLDEKPMKIEIVGSKSDIPPSPSVNLVSRVHGHILISQ